MIIRRIALFAGVVALIVGVIGLVAPVSVSSEVQKVQCGSAVAPDLSEARAQDDGNPANVPIPGGVLVDTSFTRLCDMELTDRRIWTIVLAAAGALIVAGALAAGVRSRRAARSSSPPAADR